MDSAIARTSATSNALARHLARAQYMRLTTFRKSGDPVSTPVWFALVGDLAYVVSDDPLGKVKRIRNNGRVRVAPSNFRGTPKGGDLDAAATIVADLDELDLSERALHKRYGWQWRLFRWFDRFRKHNGQPVQHVFLKLTIE